MVRIELWSAEDGMNSSFYGLITSSTPVDSPYTWDVPYDIPSGLTYSILIGESNDTLSSGWGANATSVIVSDIFQIHGCKSLLLFYFIFQLSLLFFFPKRMLLI